MPLEPNRQRHGRIVLWVVAGLTAVFVGLLVTQYFIGRVRSHSDPELLAGLQRASFTPPPATPAPAGEWPQWRGPHRDGVSGETGLLSSWPRQGPPVLWKVKGGAGYSGIAVSRGRVFTLIQEGDDEVVLCLDAETGKDHWRVRYPAHFARDGFEGPRSTPTVDGELVYTVGGTGVLHCLNAATGEKVWRHDLLAEFHAPNLQWGVSFSPLIEGDLVLTNPGGPNGNSIAAFDKRTGALVWHSLDDPAGYSSPVTTTAAGVRHVVFFTGEALVGVAPENGRLLWRYPWPTGFQVNAATPIVVGDYVFISSGYGQGCGLLKIEREADGPLQARLVYENNQMCNHFGSSVLYQEHLYGFDEKKLTCMELRTGKVVWREKGFDKGSLLAADGCLIILGEYGKLALAEASPAGYREKSSFRLFRERSWTMPSLAGGRLYARDQEEIVCVDVRQRRLTTEGTERTKNGQSLPPQYLLILCVLCVLCG